MRQCLSTVTVLSFTPVTAAIWEIVFRVINTSCPTSAGTIQFKVTLSEANGNTFDLARNENWNSGQSSGDFMVKHSMQVTNNRTIDQVVVTSVACTCT